MLGMLALHSHIFQTSGSIISPNDIFGEIGNMFLFLNQVAPFVHQMISLGELAMHSHACELCGSIFHQNDFIGNLAIHSYLLHKMEV